MANTLTTVCAWSIPHWYWWTNELSIEEDGISSFPRRHGVLILLSGDNAHAAGAGPPDRQRTGIPAHLPMPGHVNLPLPELFS